METTEQPSKTSKFGSIARGIGIVVVVAIIFSAIIASFNQKVPNSDKIWDKDMVIGNLDAENYFIIYSDIACPYCVAFENAIIENEKAFENYIEENNVLVEVRVSDFLYEYGESHPHTSRDSAIAIYCAKERGRFWDYYNLAITETWNNYFKEGGKPAVSEMSKLDLTYWEKLGTSIGLGDDFVDCVENGDPIEEIEANALKSAKAINGMPYFKFNNYISSGFDLSWGWEYVLMYFDSGLKS
ncbi:thioredoxin domain-containing protein [Candidatus Saccharibacteria bacterium]|nr:thioredoxin domain-containing protein [Candidatus Saccharibacteria bacterium]